MSNFVPTHLACSKQILIFFTLTVEQVAANPGVLGLLICLQALKFKHSTKNSLTKQFGKTQQMH